MAQVLRCDPDGLRAFAARCEEHAEYVMALDRAETPPVPHQMTVEAVSSVYAATSSVAKVLAERMRTTATALALAAKYYERIDDQSQQTISAGIDLGAR
ncbi:hypothetical protein ACPCIR_21790 [Mycobacterium sp. NPDC051198]